MAKSPAMLALHIVTKRAREARLQFDEANELQECVLMVCSHFDELSAAQARVAQLEGEAAATFDTAEERLARMTEERHYYSQSFGAALVQLAELGVNPALAGIEVPESIDAGDALGTVHPIKPGGPNGSAPPDEPSPPREPEAPEASE